MLTIFNLFTLCLPVHLTKASVIYVFTIGLLQSKEVARLSSCLKIWQGFGKALWASLIEYELFPSEGSREMRNDTENEFDEPA